MVELANPQSVVFHNTPSLLEEFIRGAAELEESGVKAITTSCGFFGHVSERTGRGSPGPGVYILPAPGENDLRHASRREMRGDYDYQRQ